MGKTNLSDHYWLVSIFFFISKFKSNVSPKYRFDNFDLECYIKTNIAWVFFFFAWIICTEDYAEFQHRNRNQQPAHIQARFLTATFSANQTVE